MVSHVDDPAMWSAAFMLATTPVSGDRKTTTALPEIPENPFGSAMRDLRRKDHITCYR